MKIYVDASGKGDWCFFNEDTNIVRTGHKDGLTSNQAEYEAVLGALSYLEKKAQNSRVLVEIYTDSQLIASQLNHVFAIRNDALRNLALEVWRLVEELSVLNYTIHFRWIPREENKAGKILG